jgi:hypothetical protein
VLYPSAVIGDEAESEAALFAGVPGPGDPARRRGQRPEIASALLE